MEYTISDRAKKVTLGLAIVGLVLLVIGFFSQKDFVYAEKINDHAVSIKYNGKAGVDLQDQLKEKIREKMHGYKVDFHDAHAHHENHTENHHASEESEAEHEAESEPE